MTTDVQNAYLKMMEEIRKRILMAEIFSENVKDHVFVESTSLQIRKILELIAYLSLILNSDKVNKKIRDEYRAKQIIEAIAEKTTIFYPFPSFIFPPNNQMDQPMLVPIGYKNSLSQEEFIKAYKKTGNILHAQHPFKDLVNVEEFARENKILLKKLKALLSNHTVGVWHEANKYTFLHGTIDFTNNDPSKPNTIREYKTLIYSESDLIKLFSS